MMMMMMIMMMMMVIMHCFDDATMCNNLFY